MIATKFTVNFKPAIAEVDRLVAKQMPFAAMQAVNTLAFEVRAAQTAALKSFFAHPRPFSQRAVEVVKATKGNPIATVRLRDAQNEYMAPYEFGGVHTLPGSGRTLINPKALKLDAYGQIRGRPRSIADKPNTFAGAVTFKRSGQTVWGFWQRPKRGQRTAGGVGTKGALRTIGNQRTGLILLARSGKALPVKGHLGFVARAQTIIDRRAKAVLEDALRRAIATAR